jgi:uncharacterized protein (DUF2252 family)
MAKRMKVELAVEAGQPGAASYDALPTVKQPYKPTPAERAAVGKQARKNAPRSSHGAWESWPERPDPVALLESQSSQRTPELVPIRYGRMLASPFAFYRGGALLMASDLSRTLSSGFRAQICGDAHLMNFGLYSSPERRLVFDINDFDETIPGPWEWDVKRLIAGFAVAADQRGFSPDLRQRIVRACARSYRDGMAEMAEKRAIEVYYARLDAEYIRDSLAPSNSALGDVDKALAKAGGKDSLRALSKLTETVNGAPRFRSNPPLLVPAEELLKDDERSRYTEAVEAALKSYRASLPDSRKPLFDKYRFKGMARKVVGVGSVGSRAWVMLFTARDAEDPLFLQAKQATSSVLEPYVGKSRYRNSGRRVVEGQQIMQAVGDILLGWYQVRGFDGNTHDFYMRQLWDGKGAFDVETMHESVWEGYARVCAWVLARAHARTGDRIAIAGYLGSGEVFDRAMVEFAEAYAEQNLRDFEALQAAEASGRIAASYGI